MTGVELSYTGKIEKQDAREYLGLSGAYPDWLSRLLFVLVFATPIGLGLFLVVKLAIPSLVPNHYFVSCWAGILAVYLLLQYVHWQDIRKFQSSFHTYAGIMPERLVLRDGELLFEGRERTVSVRLSAVQKVSVHSRVVLFWTVGTNPHYISRSFFASLEEEAEFIKELKNLTPSIQFNEK